MADSSWDALSRELLSTVPGALLLGVLSNVAFALIGRFFVATRQKVSAILAARERRNPVQRVKRDDVHAYLKTGPDKALVVHLATALAVMVWWLLFGVLGFLLSYQTQFPMRDSDRLFLTVGAYWCVFQAFGAGRAIKHAHEIFVQKPVQAFVEERGRQPSVDG